MQLDRNMLNKLLTMNDDQLATFIRSIAAESGIDPASIGLNTDSIRALRQALGNANDEDLEHLNGIYQEYSKSRRKK